MQSAQLAPRIHRAIISLAVLLLFAVSARADRPQLEDDLRSELRGKVVFLRGFYADAKLRFDRDGNLIGSATAGVWTVDSTIVISDLSIERQNLLIIKGKRALNVFDNRKGKFVSVPSSKSVQLAIELDPVWQDAAPILALLEKVIPSSFQQLSASVPDYWQCWVSGHATRDMQNGKWQCSLGSSSPDDAANRKVDSHEGGGSAQVATLQPYKIGAGVKPPKVLNRAELSITDEARQAQISGRILLSVVVDEQGHARVKGIAQPLGAGLDDQAIENVRRWKFTPGTRDGKPVPVMVMIEFNFHLE
jgi:TonB family protein